MFLVNEVAKGREIQPEKLSRHSATFSIREDWSLVCIEDVSEIRTVILFLLYICKLMDLKPTSHFSAHQVHKVSCWLPYSSSPQGT